MNERQVKKRDIKTAYRIYTEEKNVADTLAMVSRHFCCYNVAHVTGYWQGASEKSIIIEIITSETITGKVKASEMIDAIAEVIKINNDQESVLVTAHEVRTKLV